MKTRQLTDKTYEVPLSDIKFSLPPYCTCCMKPSTSTEKIKFPTSANRNAYVNMPICDDCREHRNTVSICSILIYVFSAIAGIAVFFICNSMFSDWISVAVSGVSVALVFFLMATMIKMKELPEEHSTRTKSVSASLAAGEFEDEDGILRKATVRFDFTNKEYASSFRELNKDVSGNVIERDCTGNRRSCKFTEICADWISGLLKTVLIFVVLLSVIVVIAPEFKETPAVKYSPDVKQGTKVYAEIVSITPTYPIGLGKSASTVGMPSSIVCKCVTTDGEIAWIHVSETTYRNKFDSSFSFIGLFNKRISLKRVHTITGTAYDPESVAEGLSTEGGLTSAVIDSCSIMP